MASERIPIGRFSLITRLSRKALRLYDERGLLAPEIRDLCTGYRYYAASQIPRGVLIKTLCSLGFSLADIDALVLARERQETGAIEAFFTKRRHEIRSEVQRLQQIEVILNNAGASLESIYMSLNEPLVKSIPPERVVAKRGTGPYGDTISRLMPEVCSQIMSEENKKNGLTVTGPPMTLYLDSEYREKDATMEVAVPVTGRVSLSDPAMEAKTLPGGRHLSLIHKGPYSRLHEAWSRIGEYAQKRGFVPSGPYREIYLNDPSEVPEEELLTELQIPVDLGPTGPAQT